MMLLLGCCESCVDDLKSRGCASHHGKEEKQRAPKLCKNSTDRLLIALRGATVYMWTSVSLTTLVVVAQKSKLEVQQVNENIGNARRAAQNTPREQSEECPPGGPESFRRSHKFQHRDGRDNYGAAQCSLPAYTPVASLAAIRLTSEGRNRAAQSIPVVRLTLR